MICAEEIKRNQQQSVFSKQLLYVYMSIMKYLVRIGFMLKLKKVHEYKDTILNVNLA